MIRIAASCITRPILAFALWAAIPAASAANPSPDIDLGRQVYATQCASCHGAKLEGQPNWREPGPNGRYPAPPHDVSGHTWHHPDAQLLAIIRDGTAAVVGNGYQSDMPGFAGKLTEAEIRAVLAFIKSTWPDRAAEYQRQVSGD